VQNIEKALKSQDIRAISDLRNEKVGYKIRERTLQRVPYLLVVGEREAEQGTVAVRTRKGDDLGVMTVDAFVELLAADIARKGRTVENEH